MFSVSRVRSLCYVFAALAVGLLETTDLQAADEMQAYVEKISDSDVSFETSRD